MSLCLLWKQELYLALSTGAVEYTKCIYAEGKTQPTNEFPVYDSK